MCAVPGVRIWPLASLLQRSVCVCLAAGVLTEPDGLWDAVGKADHVMFPESVSWKT